MQIARWDPIRDTVSLREAMESLFADSFVRAPRAMSNGDGFAPRADAWETADHVNVELAVPGVDPQSVDVTFDGGVLTVSGEVPVREEDKTWVLTERPRGKFVRRFNLDGSLDIEKASAKVTNGVLQLSLPKREELKPRKIVVEAA
jgi:HSP20 family protein